MFCKTKKSAKQILESRNEKALKQMKTKSLACFGCHDTSSKGEFHVKNHQNTRTER